MLTATLIWSPLAAIARVLLISAALFSSSVAVAAESSALSPDDSYCSIDQNQQITERHVMQGAATFRNNREGELLITVRRVGQDTVAYRFSFPERSRAARTLGGLPNFVGDAEIIDRSSPLFRELQVNIAGRQNPFILHVDTTGCRRMSPEAAQLASERLFVGYGLSRQTVSPYQLYSGDPNEILAEKPLIRGCERQTSDSIRPQIRWCDSGGYGATSCQISFSGFLSCSISCSPAMDVYACCSIANGCYCASNGDSDGGWIPPSPITPPDIPVEPPDGGDDEDEK